jgi:hypothetical protein
MNASHLTDVKCRLGSDGRKELVTSAVLLTSIVTLHSYCSKSWFSGKLKSRQKTEKKRDDGDVLSENFSPTDLWGEYNSPK